MTYGGPEEIQTKLELESDPSVCLTWEVSLLRQNKLGGHFAFIFLYFRTTCFVAVNKSSVESLWVLFIFFSYFEPFPK